MPIHIRAKPGEVAPVVLLVGDPQRAQFIADRFLNQAKLYTDYRLMLGFSGSYRGRAVSVQTAGMGSASAAIVVEELAMLGARALIRLGTCGAIADGIGLGEVIIATAAHSSHPILAQRFQGANFSAAPDFLLTASLYERVQGSGLRVHLGDVISSEEFYAESFDLLRKFASYHTLAAEMENYVVFALSAKYRIRAASALVVSDLIFAKERADNAVIVQAVSDLAEAVLDTLAAHEPG